MKKLRAIHIYLAMLLAALAAGGNVDADTITLTGTVRDFSTTHPDMEGFTIGSDTEIVGDPGAAVLSAARKPIYAGPPGGTTTVSGAASFDQWYNDVAGVNIPASLTITLDNTITPDPNVFTFIDGDFFPIDGQLGGNEGNIHNYHFTYEIHSRFTYQGTETFSVTGDDDIFLYIDRTLAIDLGGVHPPQSASVDLSTLGLTVGQDYDFDFFFAERHTTLSSLRIDTSILLVPEPGGAVLGLLALLAAGWPFRRSK